MMSTSISGDGSRGRHRFTLNVSETYVSDGASNYSTLSWNLVLSPIQSGWDWYYGGAVGWSVWVAGQHYEGSIDSYDGYSTVTIASGSLNVTHENDGTKLINISFAIWDRISASYLPGDAGAVKYDIALTTIPRYATITSFSVSKRDETSVTYSWSANATCDSAWYSKDNGATWQGLPTNNIVSGLSANTTYNFKLQVRRADSQLWTTSNTVQQTTYDYPYCSASSNFTIGNNIKISLYNPLKRTVSINIYGNGNTLICSASRNVNGATEISNTSSEINAQYASIPNSKSGTYKVSVTYGSSTKTRNSAGTYSINESNCKPTFSNFTYADQDTTITPLTGDNQILVDNNSNCLFTISSANKAVAKNSASITKYICQWGSSTGEVAYSSLSDVTKRIDDSTGGVLKVTAVDSRGLTTTVTKNISYVPYVSAVINNLETERKDGVDSKTFLKGKITIYGGSWNVSSDTNSINRLKYVGYSVYVNNTWSEYYDITSEILTKANVSVSGNNKIYDFDFNDEIELHANGTSGGFTVGTEYQIKFLIKDGNSSVVFTPASYQALYEVRVTDGTVAMCLHKDSNGIYHIGLNGMSDDNWLISIGGTGIIRQKT